MSTVPMIPDELVLAAVERAVRHQARPDSHAPWWAILEHLDVARRSGAARRVRAQLDALQAAGALERSRRRSVQVWALTTAGRRRLRHAARAGTLAALPESPQHRAWRDAREAAAQHVEGLESDVRDCLGEAQRLLDGGQAVGSDAWFAVAERVGRACRRLASAIYCLREWREPDDTRADLDDRLDPSDEQYDPDERARRRVRRMGRRNFALLSQTTTATEVE